MAEGQGRSSGQGLKLLYLRDYLCKYTNKEHPKKANDIIDYLAAKGIKASRKTLYTDIEALRDVVGLPIVYDARKRGYYIAKPQFDGAELALLIDCIAHASFLTEKDATQLADKIKGLANIHDLPMLAGRLGDNAHKTQTDNSVIQNMRLLNKAIKEKRQITFQRIWYVAEHDTHTEIDTEIIIASPLRITKDDGKYILRYAVDDEVNTDKEAMMEKAQRMMMFDGDGGDGFTYYKLDISLMANIKLISASVEYGRDVSNAPWESTEKPRAITIFFRNEVLGRVTADLGKDAILVSEDPYHFKVTVRRRLDAEFYEWLSGYGSFARIHSPQEAVDGLLDWYRRGLLEQELMYRYGVESSSVVSEYEFDNLPPKEMRIALAATYGAWTIDYTELVNDESGISVDIHLPDYPRKQDN